MRESGQNIHIRIYMNTPEDVEALYEYVKPIVAHVSFPNNWNIDPVKLTIKWLKPTLCIEIYQNECNKEDMS